MQKSVNVAYSYRKWPFPVKQKGWFEITASSMEDCVKKAVHKFNTDIAHYSEAMCSSISKIILSLLRNSITWALIIEIRSE